METANKGRNETLISRLSKVQKGILAYLATTPQPSGTYIGNLARTGDIIDALGGERTASKYAIVSRSLRRLEERGLVCGYAAEIATTGKGLRYALRPET